MSGDKQLAGELGEAMAPLQQVRQVLNNTQARLVPQDRDFLTGALSQIESELYRLIDFNNAVWVEPEGEAIDPASEANG